MGDRRWAMGDIFGVEFLLGEGEAALLDLDVVLAGLDFVVFEFQAEEVFELVVFAMGEGKLKGFLFDELEGGLVEAGGVSSGGVVVDVFGVLDEFGFLLLDLEMSAVLMPAAEGGLAKLFLKIGEAFLADLGLGEFALVEPLTDLVELVIGEDGEGRMRARFAQAGVSGFAFG